MLPGTRKKDKMGCKLSKCGVSTATGPPSISETSDTVVKSSPECRRHLDKNSRREKAHMLLESILDDESKSIDFETLIERMKQSTNRKNHCSSTLLTEQTFIGSSSSSSSSVNDNPRISRHSSVLRSSLMAANLRDQVRTNSSSEFYDGKQSRRHSSTSARGTRKFCCLARQLLEEKGENENDGFLSPQNGFMPLQAPLQRFLTKDDRLKEWDQLVDCTRDSGLLLSPSAYRSKVDAMPCFPVQTISDKELLRASSVLGTVLQTYWYCGANRQKPREDLLNAWGDVRARLNWHVQDEDGTKHYGLPFYTLLDYSTYNWRQEGISGSYDAMDLTLEKMKLNIHQTAPVDNSERIFYVGMALIMAQGAKLPLLCVEAQEAAANNDDGALAAALIDISETWESITETFSQINPHHGAGNMASDAVVFSRTFADTAIPMPFTRTTPGGKKIVTPSTGQSVPVFQLMDCFFNRKAFTGKHGKDVNENIEAYPRRWKEFIKAIRDPNGTDTIHVDTYIRKSGNRQLQGLYTHAIQAYAGENGFLGRHLIKMYGYMTMLFRTGRQVTMGGFFGHPLDRTEDMVMKALRVAQKDRLELRSGDELRHIARIHEHAIPLNTEESSMWSVVFDVRGQGVRCSLGDHLCVRPRNLEDKIDAFCCQVEAKLSLNREDCVNVCDKTSWEESLVYYLGGTSKKLPSVRDVAAYGDLGQYMAGDITDFTLEHLQAIKPLVPRLYSISLVQKDCNGDVTFLYLNVREWADGVASRLLVHGNPGAEIIIQIYRSRVLSRLGGHRTLFFASGTGISPFLSFYSDNTFYHDQWLVWLTQNASDDIRSDFRFICRYNQRLQIDALQTNASHKSSRRSLLHTNFVVHDIREPRGQRLASFFTKESKNYKKLSSWVADATVLACGNVGFVTEVIDLLRGVGVDIGAWIATGRLRIECFGFPGWHVSDIRCQYAPWDVLRSALPNIGCIREPLMVLKGNVYRLTQNILDIHPGGKDMILLYQGADATKAFEAVGHNKDGNAIGMLQACEVGRFDDSSVKRQNNSPASKDKGAFDIVRLAFDCAEMRNCHLIDDSLHERLAKNSEYGGLEAEVHAGAALSTHRRVIHVHLPRISKLVQAICDRYFPGVQWEDIIGDENSTAVPGKSGASSVWMSAPSPSANQTCLSGDVDPTMDGVLTNWQAVRTRDKEFLAVCVSYVATICEAVASENNRDLMSTVLAWRKDIAAFRIEEATGHA